MLADNAGNTYQLHGDNTQLATHLGEEIRVEGIAESNSASPAGAMSSPTSSGSASSGASPGAATQFSVRSVRKVADTCTNAGTDK